MRPVKKIYTRSGDGGKTILGGKTAGKDSRVAEAMGAIDELNSWIGLIRAKKEDLKIGDMDRSLKTIQTNLMKTAAVLAGSKKYRLGYLDRETRKLEKMIDGLTLKMPVLNNFIYPKGEMQIARAVCRRAERETVRLMNSDAHYYNKNILKYLNRLSDALFVIGRRINHLNGRGEEIWK